MNLELKKNDTDDLIYQIEMDSQTWTFNLWLQGGEGDQGKIVREFGTDMYTLLHLKWITNKNLLYSTWNSAQCYMPAMMREFWGRTDACICMAESLHCSPETIITLLIGYTPVQNESLKKNKMEPFYN